MISAIRITDTNSIFTKTFKTIVREDIHDLSVDNSIKVGAAGLEPAWSKTEAF